jgi:CheY-like chemotaxis protein
MDGVEAVGIIREKNIKTPIIALSANAMAENTEMFLAKGFNGFISKPIDIVQLDETLNLWLGDKTGAAVSERAAAENSFPAIANIDTRKGIAMTGGTAEGYIKVLSQFIKDASERLPLLNINNENLVVNFHALKASLATLGAAREAEEAAALESSGKAGDIGFVNENLGAFTEHLTETINNIRRALEIEKTKEDTSAFEAADEEQLALFKELYDALNSKDAAKIDNIIENLNKKQFASQTKNVLEQISDEILLTEYNNALQLIDKFIKI